MRYRFAILFAVVYCVVGYLALCGSADAYPHSDDPTVQQIINQESARVPLDRVNVELKVGGCPGMPSSDYFKISCNYDGAIYIDPDDVSSDTVAHEIGHAFDKQLMYPWIRSKITSDILLAGGQAWAPLGGQAATACIGTNLCPNEMFADGFSNCATGVKPHHDWADGWDVTRGYWMPWTPRRERKLCPLINRLGD